MSKRTPLIAGNWKMNKTASEGVELVKAISAAVGIDPNVNVVLCPPFTALASVGAAIEGSHL
ncbi:MAG: triose-phosphate isomerase, partial [Verrucomicrobia bacterium]|nr:triose-phosphate isomerase [Verrucomicrobiota bacterium]